MKKKNIWENGLGQNVIFLAQLLQRLPRVRSVLLIDMGDQTSLPAQVKNVYPTLERVGIHDATDLVDVVIEMAGALNPQWLSLMRSRGKRVVSFRRGQPYAALVECAVFNKPAFYHPPERYDEVWVLPKDEAFGPMLRTLHRCPVVIAPFIWEPTFLEWRIREVRDLCGVEYGYRKRVDRAPEMGAGLRVATFEPNISVVKTCSIPLLVIDEAFRKDSTCIESVSILNSLHMANHPTLLYLANSLDFVKKHKAVFLGRHDAVGFMVGKADAVVAHQWQCEQNYNYLDVLYGNYPLVHNSPWLQEFGGVGYYYSGFDAGEGGNQLRLAFEAHDEQLETYRARSQRVFNAVDPHSAANAEAYTKLLSHLCCGTSYECAA